MANTYGINVGDIFKATWGHGQTNVDFFQVTEVVGASSVRIREVRPYVLDTKNITDMSQRITYGFKANMPAVERSIYIRDQARGDLKRLAKLGDECVVKFDKYTIAHKCADKIIEVYESTCA